ncbi:hypothetical protein K2Z84_30310 [Candidatus Binatia bacterium]|nr:hypothetical protein [Candidatus Binatia bacterium]
MKTIRRIVNQIRLGAAAAVLASVALAAPASATEIFSDNFNRVDGNLGPDWTQPDILGLPGVSLYRQRVGADDHGVALYASPVSAANTRAAFSFKAEDPEGMEIFALTLAPDGTPFIAGCEGGSAPGICTPRIGAVGPTGVSGVTGDPVALQTNTSYRLIATYHHGDVDLQIFDGPTMLAHLTHSTGASFTSYGMVVGRKQDGRWTWVDDYVLEELAGGNGDVCSAGSECESGSCIDGVCCNTACGDGDASDCQACSIAAGGTADGTCTLLSSATVCRASEGECDAAETCNGSSPSCPADVPAPAGTACSADDTACTTDVCDGSGACTHPAAVRTDCNGVGKAALTIVNDPRDDKDTFGLSFAKAPALTLDEMGHPTTTTGYAVCVYDSRGLVLHADVPPGGTCGGKPCWKTTRVHKYADKAGSNDGITSLLLKPSTSDQTVVQAKGKGADLDDPSRLPLVGRVTAQTINLERGCFEATFDADQVGKNDAGHFTAKR